MVVVRPGNGEGGIVGSGDELVRSAHPHRRGWGHGEDFMHGKRKTGGRELPGRLRRRRSAGFIPDCELQ